MSSRWASVLVSPHVSAPRAAARWTTPGPCRHLVTICKGCGVPGGHQHKHQTTRSPTPRGRCRWMIYMPLLAWNPLCLRSPTPPCQPR
ncbi:hypothetical protein BDV09DRAFT_58855 [Aspergillus tetrazonus]